MDLREELLQGKSLYELPLKVVYYARVSTENDTQTTSILNQTTYFQNYIKNIPEWQLYKGYIDEGISGKAIKNREKFQQMIIDGLNCQYNLILTKSVSRFARNTIDSIKYTDILKEKGIGVIFLNDNINTLNSDSEFRLTLMASIAQDEIRKLSESVKFGLKQSIKRGIVLGNNNILGYNKNKGKLVINNKEAKIVKEIYSKFITKKYNYRKLANYINDKYQKNFDSTSIRRILTNYKYKGYYCGNKTTTIDYKTGKRKNKQASSWLIYKDYKNIPPIIKETTWNIVQDIIKARKNNRSTNRYLNKIICANHHKKYHHLTKKYKNKIYSYYTCPNCVTLNEEILNKITSKLPNYQLITIYPHQEYLKLKVKIYNKDNIK